MNYAHIWIEEKRIESKDTELPLLCKNDAPLELRRW